MNRPLQYLVPHLLQDRNLPGACLVLSASLAEGQLDLWACLVLSASHAVENIHLQSPTVLSASLAVGQDLAWEGTDEQIDRRMLMTRDPILHFDEVLLYESELDDLGTSQLSLKVYVHCWFLAFWHSKKSIR